MLSRLDKGDVLLVAELSRLGRNMFEVINLINQLSERGVKLIFVRQPELSTAGPHGKLLLAIYSYFAEAEREFISVRTKQGLAAARAGENNWVAPRGVETRSGSWTHIGSRSRSTYSLKSLYGGSVLSSIHSWKGRSVIRLISTLSAKIQNYWLYGVVKTRQPRRAMGSGHLLDPDSGLVSFRKCYGQ